MDVEIYDQVKTLMEKLRDLRKDPALTPKEKYNDAASLPVRFPDSVVIVTTKTQEQFPTLEGEIRRFNNLDEALITFRDASEKYDAVTSISIIVDEGIYVDNLRFWQYSERIEIDIIGMGTTVFVQLQQEIALYGANFTITNVRIVSPQVKPEYQVAMLNLVGKSRVHFTDVHLSLNTTSKIAMYVKDAGTKVVLKDCSITGGSSAFYIQEATSMELDKCKFSKTGDKAGFVRTGAVLFASETTFEKCQGLWIQEASATLQCCSFLGEHSGSSLPWYPTENIVGPPTTSNSKQSATVAFSQSKIKIVDTTYEGFNLAIAAHGQSEAELSKCTIRVCNVATSTSRASKLRVHDCTINSHRLLDTFSNEKGLIEFKKNKFPNRQKPLLSMDQELPASSFKHDFPSGRFKVTIYSLESYAMDRHRLERKCRTTRDDPKLRSCEKCFLFEEPTREEEEEEDDLDSGVESGAGAEAAAPKFTRFKLCGKCRSSAYCTKKCQQDDWPYHKKFCKIFQEKMKK